MATPHDSLQHRPVCSSCNQSTLQPQVGELEYTFDDFHVVVSDVPMMVCEACGHRLVPGPVAVQIDDEVRDTVAQLRHLEHDRHPALELDRLDLTYRESDDRELALA